MLTLSLTCDASLTTSARCFDYVNDSVAEAMEASEGLVFMIESLVGESKPELGRGVTITTRNKYVNICV